MFAALDIETVPAWDEVPEELRPQPAFGNLKDPEKIAAKVKAFEQDGQRKAMATNPMFAKVVFVVFHDGTSTMRYSGIIGEKALLSATFESLLNGPDKQPLSIVTKYGKGFDIPVLLARGLLLNLLSPADANLIRKLYLPKYRTEDTHIDLQDCPELGGLRLDTFAPRILGKHKLGDGSQVEKQVNEGKWRELGDYCQRDAELTWEVAQRFHLIPQK